MTNRKVSIEDVPRDVRDKFEELALYLINRGWQRYSARGIMHRIRWHITVEKNHREFKVNNNWSAPMSRWFLAKYPQHAGFFEVRERKSEETYWD
jgi:hypothetical protein